MFLKYMDCHCQPYLESNHESKFLTDDTGVIVAAPTRSLLIDTLASCCDVPMIMN